MFSLLVSLYFHIVEESFCRYMRDCKLSSVELLKVLIVLLLKYEMKQREIIFSFRQLRVHRTCFNSFHVDINTHKLLVSINNQCFIGWDLGFSPFCNE